jgi:hypothetical protein
VNATYRGKKQVSDCPLNQRNQIFCRNCRLLAGEWEVLSRKNPVSGCPLNQRNRVSEQTNGEVIVLSQTTGFLPAPANMDKSRPIGNKIESSLQDCA